MTNFIDLPNQDDNVDDETVAAICEALGVYPAEILTVDVEGEPTAVFSESALYKLALQSDESRSRHFLDWVAIEVLPAIRKHGRYERKDGDFVPWPEAIFELIIEENEREIARCQERAARLHEYAKRMQRAKLEESKPAEREAMREQLRAELTDALKDVLSDSSQSEAMVMFREQAQGLIDHLDEIDLPGLSAPKKVL